MCPSTCLISTLVIHRLRIDHRKLWYMLSYFNHGLWCHSSCLGCIQSRHPTQDKTTSASYCPAKKKKKKKKKDPGGWSESRRVNGYKCCFLPYCFPAGHTASFKRKYFQWNTSSWRTFKVILVKHFVPLVRKRQGRLPSKQNFII